MRTNLLLIQSALGTMQVSEADIERIDRKTEFLSLYAVTLPEKFKGLPYVWYFGILAEDHAEAEDRRILAEARDVIRELKEQQCLPIVLISDDRGMHFGSHLTYNELPVFFLAKFELLGRDNFSGNARDAPILMAARKKFSSSKASYYLSPYSPNMPALDWRFFGRKKEVHKIVAANSNFFVIGARRIGKTSLLQEVKSQLAKRGEKVYWIQCQYAKTISEVITQICVHLLERDYKSLLQSRRSEENFLMNVLRRLKGQDKHIVLFFDEIGNAIAHDTKIESWRFIGVLRELSHSNEMRFILSAFQQTVMKQINNFDGPFVNFGSTLKIHSFNRSEVDDILVLPLKFWGKIRDHTEFRNRVKRHFGSHPLILQYLGQMLFENIVNKDNVYLDDVLIEMDKGENLKGFTPAVNDIFNRTDYLERYVYLKICVDIDIEKNDLVKVEIKQDRIKKVLEQIGVKSELDTRELLLERLDLRGLLSQDPTDLSIYRIDSPVIYTHLKTLTKTENLLRNYIEEIEMDTLDISQLKW